ncbi:MAG: SURF1 family protein, partial [Wenzhouxiangellaceae bacterium]
MRVWIPHLAAAGVIAACVWLTLWQLDRAGQKQVLIDRAQARAMTDLIALQAPYDLPQPIAAHGRWLDRRQVLLDNKVREHVPGVFVLTPLRLSDGRIFMVNRGWVARTDRNAPPPDPRLMRGVWAEPDEAEQQTAPECSDPMWPVLP